MKRADPAPTRSTERHLPKPPGGDTGDALAVLVTLSRAYHAVARQLEVDMTRHGLTIQEFAILEVLHFKGRLLLGEIQRKILVSSGGITYLVDRLTAKGLVERQECEEDRRARYAALTTEGERLIRRIFPEHARTVERVLGGLTPEEHRLIRPMLRRLGRHAAELPPSGADR